MSNVKRVYVEKKAEFAVQANSAFFSTYTRFTLLIYNLLCTSFKH